MQQFRQVSGQAFRIAEINPYKRQGVILQMARVAQGVSRKDLADRVGVSDDTVRRWETGERTIDGVMLGSLAQELDQDVAVFWS